MNEDTDYKEVNFKKYCPLCKYYDLNDFENPCNECLTWPTNYGTRKPLMFMEEDKE